MSRLSEFLRNPFSLFSAQSAQQNRIVTYIVREHGRGRALAEILEDPYIRNRLTPQERDRLLDRPELIHALGSDTVSSAREEIRR